MFSSAGARTAVLVRVGLVVAAFATLGLAIVEFAPSLTDPSWLRTWIRSTGPFAPLVFVGIQTAQVIVAPIPGQMLAAVGGYLFGTVGGTAYSMVGVTTGSAIVFVLARRYGRPAVEKFVAESTLARFDEFIEKQGIVGLFLLFLLPTFPDDALCAIAGLSTLRLRTLLVLVVVGRLPTFALAASAGQQVGGANYATTGALVGAMLVVSGVVYVYRDQLTAALDAA